MAQLWTTIGRAFPYVGFNIIKVVVPVGCDIVVLVSRDLVEFVIKGFVLDDERLKLNKRFGKDYFDELLERIREIRASERRFYLKITDIYEQASIDYDKAAEITKTFFKTVQNKLHWAVTGNTRPKSSPDGWMPRSRPWD